MEGRSPAPRRSGLGEPADRRASRPPPSPSPRHRAGTAVRCPDPRWDHPPACSATARSALRSAGSDAPHPPFECPSPDGSADAPS
jgi:hypothetical protein